MIPDDESNFIQLLKLRGKDQPLLLKWLQRKEDRYTSHDIQNEMIVIMANHVFPDLVSEIRGGFFSIICDEYTDISNKEQLIICIRWVDKELEAYEDPTHCHGHSLSLSAKDTTKNCKLFSDTMDTAKEIVSLIKFSLKRENLLGEIRENLEVPESD